MKPTLDTVDILATAFELTQAKTREAVYETLSKLAARQGFDGFLYGARFSLGSTRHTDFIMSDYDTDWRHTYDTAGYAMLDPTVAHAVSSVVPLVWSDAMYHTEAQRNFAEEARAHGIQTGATLPVQTREGDVAMLSFTNASQGVDARRLVEESLVWGTLVATVAHETMRKLIKPTLVPTVRLTRREMEVLKWIAAGKTDWEMSRLMGISEHGVVHHVRNIMLKYDVVSRFQAVAKAAASEIEF